MNNLNAARAKSGTATADDTEVVDFAERLRYVMKLKVNKLKTIMQKSNTHLEADMSMIVTQALEWVQGRIQDIILNNVRTDWLVYNDK